MTFISECCVVVVWGVWGVLAVIEGGHQYTALIIGERAKRARHYQGCTNSSWCGIYIYIARCQVVVKFYRDLYFGYSPP